jgi:hypothetical protein
MGGNLFFKKCFYLICENRRGTQKKKCQTKQRIATKNTLATITGIIKQKT